MRRSDAVKRAVLVMLLTGCYAAHERPLMCNDDMPPTLGSHYGVVGIFTQTSERGEGWAVSGFFGPETLMAHDANEIAGSDVIVRAGDCAVLGAAAAVAEGQDAGDLSASDGHVIAVAHASAAYHDAESIDSFPVAPGDVVQLTGSGAVVPPFAACVTMPAEIQHAILPARWTAGTALVARWDPTRDFDMAELEIGAVVDDRIQLIFCRVEASAGQVQVPASLRDEIASGSQITLTLSRTRVVSAGDYAIRASAARSLTGTLTRE
jgi:hypothetical protein